MSNFTVYYNRTTNHIGGAAIRSGGEFTMNACGSLTRGNLAKGKSYSTIHEALAAAKNHSRRICKNCEKAALAQIAAEVAEAEIEAYDSLADQELSNDEQVVAEAIAEQTQTEQVEGAKHQVGDEPYFLPSADRAYGAFIPAGKVVVTRVVDHGEPSRGERFTYVVQVPNVPAATQGTDSTELFAAGSVPKDLRFWETYITAVCSECRAEVAYANSKIVSEPIHYEGKVYAGMPTRLERRVCAHH